MRTLVYQASTRTGHYINARPQPIVTPIRVHQNSVGHYLAVTFNGKKIQTINPATKDWPKYDADPAHCTGAGHATCEKNGIHSFFNHSQDSYRDPKYQGLSNLPTGFVEE
jgi:hypothetical protein